ncbi:hypothetical protein F511_20639 [Dorcoceras hygrometricum]|uniref:Uncharacterized protein n=1 Tax=Dorcoceras hygrometricum TaxID=472368 RepID=A0A2Z7A8U4_9LAMI|nr:hypothetical protein F511_20639 [Dorcoceras hygrometricum]
MYILTNYRELLLRKFLEARRSNFVAGHSLSAVDLIVLDMLSDLHRVVLEELQTQMQVYGLTWEMMCYSSLFEEAAQFYFSGKVHPVGTFNRCKILAVVSNAEFRDVLVDQTEFCETFRRGLDVQIVLSDSSSRSSSSHELMDFHVNIPSNEETSVTQFDSLVDPPVVLSDSSSRSSSSHELMDFHVNIPSNEETSVTQFDSLVDPPVGTDTPVDQISLPTAPTTDAAESFTALRASISRIFANRKLLGDVMAGLAVETPKSEPADRNQAKAKLNRDAYVDSNPYVESCVDSFTYVEFNQLLNC